MCCFPFLILLCIRVLNVIAGSKTTCWVLQAPLAKLQVVSDAPKTGWKYLLLMLLCRDSYPTVRILIGSLFQQSYLEICIKIYYEYTL